jgi:hypothetical protein
MTTSDRGGLGIHDIIVPVCIRLDDACSADMAPGIARQHSFLKTEKTA